MSSSLWNQARALGESTSHSRTLRRVIPILHQESWIMCFYLFVWYGSWKGLHTVITEPTWQWLCWLNASKGNHRKQFNWNSIGVCSLLLVRLCGKFLSAQRETTDCCLRPELKPPRQADLWCHSRVFWPVSTLIWFSLWLTFPHSAVVGWLVSVFTPVLINNGYSCVQSTEALLFV